MRRRTVLATLAAGTAGLAGCHFTPGSGTSKAGETELPEITVEYRLPDRLSALIAEETLVVERERLRYVTRCTVTDSVGRDIDAHLAGDSYRRLQRLVVRSEPETWQAAACNRDCVSADDDWDLAVTVDGERFETAIDRQQRGSGDLGLLVEFLDRLATRFDDEPACLAANVEPPVSNETCERDAQ